MTRNEGFETLEFAKKIMRRRTFQSTAAVLGIGVLLHILTSVSAGYGRAEAVKYLMKSGLDDPNSIWDEEKDEK